MFLTPTYYYVHPYNLELTHDSCRNQAHRDRHSMRAQHLVPQRCRVSVGCIGIEEYILTQRLRWVVSLHNPQISIHAC